MSSEKYIGLDVHQATISVAVLDSTGKLVMESILETKAATSAIREKMLCSKTETKVIVSTPTSWPNCCT